MKRVFVALACLLLVACDQSSAPEAGPITPVSTDAPAGDYTLDKTHASLIFRVDHLGFSTYTASFNTYDATLKFDPQNVAAMQFDGTVDVSSLTLINPPAGFVNDLLSDVWFDAVQYPTITFHSTAVELTGPNTANVTGDFTLHGVTKPLVLAVTFNGGYPGHPYDPNARIGFSATSTLLRSDFGITYGIPEAGSKMGVSDAVEITLEGEFSGPPLQNDGAATSAPEAQ
jgi:polyisoprenoid-binding protein YceI